MALDRTTPARRRFLQGVGAVGFGLLAGCAAPFSAPPPAAKVHRIAYLSASPPNPASAVQMAAFRQSLRDLGYVEGQNLLIDERYAHGGDQLAEPAAELVRLQPEVILVAASGVAHAMQAATTTIPIVSAGAGPDLVAMGVVASLGRPGGNVTGLSTPLLAGKQLQLLQEVVPTLSRVAVLFDATIPADFEREPFEAAARGLGLQLQFVGAHGPQDLEPGFATAVRGRADGLFLSGSPVIVGNQTRIGELAIQSRLPSMWQQSEAVGRGGLMGYGSNRADLYRRAATYVDKILKGARPADLPVEQPTKFDFVINLKIAQALGLSVPQSLLQHATEVIQ